MRWRRKRRLGFFSGLVVGVLLGLSMTAVFGWEIQDGARRLQEGEQHWRARSIEIAGQARTEVELLLTRAGAGFEEQLNSFFGGSTPNGE